MGASFLRDLGGIQGHPPRFGMDVRFTNPSPCVTQTLKVQNRKCIAVNVVAAFGARTWGVARGGGEISEWYGA